MRDCDLDLRDFERSIDRDFDLRDFDFDRERRDRDLDRERRDRDTGERVRRLFDTGDLDFDFFARLTTGDFERDFFFSLSGDGERLFFFFPSAILISLACKREIATAASLKSHLKQNYKIKTMD